MLTATSPSLPASSHATRINSPCALCNAPIVGTSTRRFERSNDCASATVVMIRMPAKDSSREIAPLRCEHKEAGGVTFFQAKLHAERPQIFCAENSPSPHAAQDHASREMKTRARQRVGRHDASLVPEKLSLLTKKRRPGAKTPRGGPTRE